MRESLCRNALSATRRLLRVPARSLVVIVALGLGTGPARSEARQTRYPAEPVPQSLRGTWRAQFESWVAEGAASPRLRLTLVVGDSAQNTQALIEARLPVAGLRGLSRSMLNAGVPAEFVRGGDPGVVRFRGAFAGHYGTGTFIYQPDPEYVRELRSMGYPNLSDLELVQLAVHEVPMKLGRDLRDREGNLPTIQELVSLAALGASPTTRRDMRAVGFEVDGAEELLQLLGVGLTPDVVQGFADLGYHDIAPARLRSLIAVGVTPSFVRAMRRRGYDALDLNAFEEAGAQGVTIRLIDQLTALGYAHVFFPLLKQLAAVGVTATYLQDLESVHLSGIGLERIRDLRASGVTASYVRQLRAGGSSSSDADNVLRAWAIETGTLAPGKRRTQIRKP